MLAYFDECVTEYLAKDGWTLNEDGPQPEPGGRMRSGL
jgi:hypothetical protein